MPQITYFSTPTCGPCKMFKPVVQQVAADLGISIRYVDASTDSATAQQYNINSVPTIVVAENGAVVYKHTGVLDKRQLANLFNTFK